VRSVEERLIRLVGLVRPSGWGRNSVRVAVSACGVPTNWPPLNVQVISPVCASLPSKTSCSNRLAKPVALCVNSALKLVPVGQVVQSMCCAIAGVSFSFSASAGSAVAATWWSYVALQ
jgi:hypothetical protein